MRKNFIYLAIAAIALAGCAKESQISVTAPQDGKAIRTITASIPETKTSVEINEQKEGIYSWTENEKISVCVVNGNSSSVEEFQVADLTNGTFQSVNAIDETAALSFAVSPASALDVNSAADETDVMFTIKLSGEYDSADGTNAVMLAGAPEQGADGNDKFTFRHVAGLMKVTYQNVPVGTYGLRYTTDKPIVGDFYFESIDGVELTQPATGDETAKVWILDGVTKPNTTVEFYVPVPTGNYGSFEVALFDENGADIEGTVRSMTANFTVNKADIVRIPTIKLEAVEITKGDEWSYTFENKVYSEIGTQTLNGIDWALTGDGTYFGNCDATKGQQFGSGSAPFSSLTFTANLGAVYGISDIVINTSGAKSIEATVSVSVGGTSFVIGDAVSASLTTDATDYLFSSPDGKLYLGDVVITYSQTSEKAIYLKSISINPDTRLDPQLSFGEASYSATVGGSFTAPTLQTVDGFTGTVTYAIGSEDDSQVASVNATTGEVTIGSKTGSVTITASFAGDNTYKAASASYVLNVVDELIIYELYSGEITEGSYIIVYDGAAMNTTVSSDRLQYEEVEINANNQILNPADDIIWGIKANGDYWTLYNESKAVYAASTGVNNKAKTEASITDNSRWTISGTETYEFVNKANTGNKNLRKNGTYGFACYGTSTGGALTLYKLNDGKESATLSFSPESYNDEIGNIANFVAPTVNKTEGLVVSFESSNTSVATVTDAGVVALVGAVGEATITATAAEQTIGDKTYRAATATFTVKVSKTVPTIAFSEPTTSVNIGETVTNVATITPNTLSFSYSSSNETVATVTSAGVVTGVKVGTATITASRDGDDSYEAATASYEITVVDPNANDGTAAKPYTATEAAELALGGSTASVYVKGIISSIATAYSAEHGNISFYISEDASSDVFQIYRGVAEAADQFQVGDYVVFHGTLGTHSSAGQMAAGGTCYSQVKAPRFSLEAGAYGSAQSLELTADDGAVIYYTTDGSAPTTSSATYSAAISVSDDMTVRAFAVKDGISTGTVSHSYTIDANANDGSAEKPYSASEAAQLALDGSTASVYVKGIISSIATAYSAEHGNISFYISEDGSSDVFQIYRGVAEAADQFQVGDYVVFHGALGTHNSAGQMAAGGTCNKQVKAPRFTPDGGSFTSDSQSVTLTADSGAKIYYSLDNSEPTTEYSSPLSLTATTTVKAKAVLDDITTGIVSKTFTKSSLSDKTYTISWNATNNSKGVSSYTESWSVTADGLTCNMANWNNNNNGWGFVKAGQKNNASTATIITGAAITEAIKTVKLTIDALTASNITSIKLYVSDSSTFGTTAAGTFTAAKGEQSVTISSPAANKYYKIEVVCTSGSGNGLIQVSKLVFTTL